MKNIGNLKIPVGAIFIAMIAIICADWYIFGPGEFGAVSSYVFWSVFALVVVIVVWAVRNWIKEDL